MRLARILLIGGLVVGFQAAVEAQPRQSVPVGLVISSGATLTRNGASIPAKAGEVLFAGDALKSGSAAATFLFCPQKLSTTIAPDSEAVMASDAVQVRSGSVQNSRQIAACFLPAVQKLSVASMQHYGVMLARSGSTPPPSTTLVQRIATLPEAIRTALNAELDASDVALVRNPDDLGALIARGAAFERAGLLFDAGEAYRRVADLSPDLGWAKAKVMEIERTLERDQLKKE